MRIPDFPSAARREKTLPAASQITRRLIGGNGPGSLVKKTLISWLPQMQRDSLPEITKAPNRREEWGGYSACCVLPTPVSAHKVAVVSEKPPGGRPAFPTETWAPT